MRYSTTASRTCNVPERVGGGGGELGNGVDPHHALACAYQARVTAPAHKVTLFLAFIWAGNAACIPLTKGGVMMVDISQQVFRLNFSVKTPLELHTRLLVTFFYCSSDLKPQRSRDTFYSSEIFNPTPHGAL